MAWSQTGTYPRPQRWISTTMTGARATRAMPTAVATARFRLASGPVGRPRRCRPGDGGQDLVDDRHGDQLGVENRGRTRWPRAPSSGETVGEARGR